MRFAAKLAFVFTTSLATAAAACGGDSSTDEQAGTPRTDAEAPIVVPDGSPIVIGVSIPITGPDSALGIEDRDAVITAVRRWTDANGDKIKGHEIEVRAEDDGCTDAAIAANAAERLVSIEGLVGVLGPDCSEGALAAIPVYAQAGVVAVSGSATGTELTTDQSEGGYFFRTAYRNDLQGAFIGLFAAAQLQGETAYLIDDGETYGIDLADGAQSAMEANGVTVTRETIERGAVDFTELAGRVAADAPTFVGFAGFNPEAALLYRQLRDAGYPGGFGAGDGAASLTEFVEPVGAEAAEGVVFSGCPLLLPEDFVDDFEAVHGSPPEASGFVGQYADATTALLNAVAATTQEQSDGSLTLDPAELRDGLRNTGIQDGISGSFWFDPSGDRVSEQGSDLNEAMEEAVRTADIGFLVDLGLVPCQVLDGKLVNQFGPGTALP